MKCLSIMCVFVAGLASGAIGAAYVFEHSTPFVFGRGDEAVSIVDDEVMSVIFMADMMTFTAQRSIPGATFAVQASYADGRQNQQCTMSPDLSGQLHAFATLTVKHQIFSLDRVERDFPIVLGTLQLGTRVKVDPLDSYLFRASADRKAVVAIYDGAAIEVTTPATAFQNLEKGCGFLGIRAGH